MVWFHLLAVEGTLKSLLQHHSSYALILQHSVVFIVQLSNPYMTTGKAIALIRWTFVDKVMSLLFNMLSRLVITFLSRNKCLLISWLQSPSAVILEPPKIKSATVSTVSPSIFHEVMGLDAMIFIFWMLSFTPTFSLSSFTFIKSLFRLIEFCQENPLVIANTLFQQHKRRLYTWTSPDGQHWNQIDYILYSQRWRSYIPSAKTRLGADCGSDHELLIAKFRLKLKKVGKTTRPSRYDLNQIPYDYTVEVRKRFKGLDLTDFPGQTSLVAQTVKPLPAMRETWVWSLGWEDAVEKEMATHSSTLAWKIPWTEEPDRLQSMGMQRVGYDWVTSLSDR